MICSLCHKEKPVVFELDAATRVKNAALQRELDEAGRGAAAGPLHLCSTCMLEGYQYKKKEAA